MIEITSTKENLSNLFRYWINLYNNKQFPDFEAVYQFVLKKEEETYYFYLSVSDGKAGYGEGKHKSPSITIYSPVSVWLDITSGKLSGTQGYLARKYRIEGPLYYLKMLNKVFGKKFTNEEIPGVEDKIQDFEIPQKRLWKKPKKVLVINGSPRRKSGFTYFYLKYLIKGIEQTGTEVEGIDIYDEKLSIEPCRGCFTCWTKTNGKCVIKDDANELIEKINNTYLTVYAFPLYIDSVPAKMKAFLDRQFITVMPVFVPYQNLTRHPIRDTKERYMALFSISGFPEIEHFRPIAGTFKGIARNSHRPLVATILRPGAESVTAPPYRNYLKEILASLEQAGKELVEQGKVSKRVLKFISSDYSVSKELWRTYSNLHWFLKRNGGEKDEKFERNKNRKKFDGGICG
ncbi:MAG: NAD(P)H-dependent oxidoreductase [Thermoplasmatales archaeon]|nr:NAD(P)H-dependent oxidoreductase [Thermoplasmatales archaeon]